MSKKIVTCGILSALAIIISSLERFIPLQSFIPLPGIKLGLSNCIILFLLLKSNPNQAFTVMSIKCIVVSMLFSGFSSFLYSYAGGLLSFFVMYLLSKNKYFTIYGISIAGAACHNIGQIAIASLLMQNEKIFIYLSPLILVSIFTGIIVALITIKLIERVKI